MQVAPFNSPVSHSSAGSRNPSPQLSRALIFPSQPHSKTAVEMMMDIREMDFIADLCLKWSQPG